MQAKITVRNIPGFVPQERPYEIHDTDNQGLVLRIQPSGVCTFYAVYRVEGKRQRYRIGNAGQFVDNGKGVFSFKPNVHPDVARKVLKEKTGEAAAGKDPQAERKRRRMEQKTAKSRTVRGFFENHYVPWLLTERRSGKATAARIISCFGYLFDKPMTDVNPFLLQNWRRQKLEDGLSPHTLNRDIGALKSMFSKAVEWNLLKENPLSKLKRAKAADNSRVRYLSPDEGRRLLAALDQREADGRSGHLNKWRRHPFPKVIKGEFIDNLKPLVLLALNTGLRRGELFSLDWSDIDFLQKQLTVRAASSKGARPRYIPLNTTARNIFKLWQKQTSATGLVFPGRKGNRLNNISNEWRSLITSAGIEDFTFHDLRHDFATKALKAGADIVTLSKLLGHSDLKMTLRYSHVTDEALKEAVERIG